MNAVSVKFHSFVDIDENTDFKEFLKSEIDVPISSQFLIYIKASIDVRKLIDQFLADTQQTRKEKKKTPNF